MLCVTGRVDRKKVEIPDNDLLRIHWDCELILRNRQKLTPESLHPISVNARGAGDQLFRIQQMRRAIRVDKDLRALTREPARRACMVKVDVREQNVGNVSVR